MTDTAAAHTGPVPTAAGRDDTAAGHRPTGRAVQLLHLIEGIWREGGGQEIKDINPAQPDDLVAYGHLAEPVDVGYAVDAAVKAAPGWAATPFPVRGEILHRAAAVLADRAEDWGHELAREEGKTLAEGVGEVRRAADIFRFYASEGLRPIGEVYASPRPGENIQVIHRPLGTVAIVTPFNFPIGIPAWKIAPALAYGNTVVWKPATTVPLLAMRLAQALTDAGLPGGVLNLLVADGVAGAHLVEHPGIDAVSFTGSTGVGRTLIERCGALGRPIQTEMGGKNAAAVLADADLDLAVAEVAAGAFRSTGQKCTATSRVIVSAAVADEFLRKLRERIDSLTVGDPVDPDVQIGPLVTAAARDEILQAVQKGRDRPGVQVITGGHGYDDERAAGAFLAPTLVEVDGDDPLWREELFGPVLTVRRAAEDAQALELINDSVFGLSAAVFTDNLKAVTAAQETVDVGVLHINSETAGADPHVPFGGTKASAFGPKEQGRAAREFFTKTTTVYLKASGRLDQ